MNRENRDYSLDFIKICATIFIVFHHYQQVTGAYWENHINFWGGRFYWGNIVELFFVISGFVSFSYIKRIENGYRFRPFMLRKMKRLLPLVAISAVVYEIALIAYYRIYGGDWFGVQVNFFGIFIDALGIQSGWVFSDPSVNYPTWYISVLLVCYIVFYISTSYAARKNIPLIYMYIGIIFAGCAVNAYAINLPFLNSQTARGYYAFFTGVILAMALNKYDIGRKAVIISIINIVVILYMIVRHGEWIPWGISYLVTFILYPSIIILFETKTAKRIFRNRIWGKLGAISYDVYIWHNPMYLMMYVLLWITQWTPDLNKISSMYIYCAIAELVGIISYYALEMPIAKWIDKRVPLENVKDK